MEWVNIKKKGIRLRKQINNNHYEICWNYDLNILTIHCKDTLNNKNLFFRTFKNVDLKQFPELKKNKIFMKYWYKQIAYEI